MYNRIRLASELSDTADYANPLLVAPPEFLVSPTRFIRSTVGVTSTATEYVYLTAFTTVQGFVVANRSSTTGENVRVRWYVPIGNTTDTVTFANNATGDTITDDSGTATWISQGSAATRLVRLANCANATNGSTTSTPNTTQWPIASSTNTVITLVAQMSVNPDANDAVLLYFESRCEQVVQPGGMMFIGGPISPYGRINLISETGTPITDVYTFGT